MCVFLSLLWICSEKDTSLVKVDVGGGMKGQLAEVFKNVKDELYTPYVCKYTFSPDKYPSHPDELECA